MAEIIEKQIENLNNKLCELYPADTAHFLPTKSTVR